VSHIPSLRHPRNTLLVPALLAVAGLLAWAGSAEAKGKLQRQSILEGFVPPRGTAAGTVDIIPLLGPGENSQLILPILPVVPGDLRLPARFAAGS